MKPLVICASVLGLLTAAANAADITWGTPTGISGTSDVNIQGTLYGSWAPGDDWGGGDRSDYFPVNGVTFAAYGTSGVDFNISGSGINMDRYNGFADPGTPDSNYNHILHTAEFNYNASSSSIVVSWDNLTPGDTYLVQVWLNDGRSSQPGTSVLTGGANSSAPVAIGNGVPGQYIIGTFVADGGSQSFTMTPGIMLNLIQVRDITPTPNVTWQAPAAVAGTADVNTNGSYFGSWAPYNSDAANYGSTGLPVNGTKFVSSCDLPNFATVGFNNGYTGFNNPNTSDAIYNDLLQSATYEGNGDGRPVSFNWNGMTPGHTYQIQIWANDGRGNHRTESFTGGTSNSASLNFGDAPGAYIIGTFVAGNGGRQIISLSGAGSPNGPYPQVNLLQVRDITVLPNITWQSPAAISGPSDVNTNGTYFASWAPYNQDAANNGSSGLVVNGTKFVAFNDFPLFFTVGFNNGYNGFHNPGTSDANYNDLLQTAAYEGNGDGRTVSLNWGGMTAGHTYQIQIWANDGRGNGRSETFTGGANTSASLDFGDAPAAYIIGTFVATGSGLQTVVLSGAGSANGPYPQINLVQVRDLTPPPLQFTGISVSGTTLNLSAVGGANNGQFVLLGTTNLLTPLGQWKPLLTNNFDGNGRLNLSTNILNPAAKSLFYRLVQ
ncbi:MAG TPA: hypothetical protein VG347_11265 [Verrucomicrobiae bacterium]|nr:hypothetical protein [Verrucomicrobiae bacterium]